MRETLYNANGLDRTRIKRAFGWIVTFRDFPKDSFQTVDGDSMMSEAVTYFTKGRAEFYLDGIRRNDRVSGILSTEHEEVGRGGEFKLVYTEPTTRVCIPLKLQPGKNKNVTPRLRQHQLSDGIYELPAGKYLVCLGSVEFKSKVFEEESTFQLLTVENIKVASNTLLLEFL